MIPILILSMFLVGCAATTEVQRVPEADYFDTARVISADPVYETVQVIRPVKKCWNAEVEHRSGGDSPTGTLAGGIVGGVIGNQFGRGSGKAAMTVAGALLGASVGHDLSQQPERRYVTDERQCEYVDDYTQERQISGYRVTYKYHDKILVTHTERRPGESIPIAVTVEPIH